MENVLMNFDGQVLTVAISGRLDTTNAQKFSTEVLSQLKDVKTVVFECANLEYVSSAGLRVFIQVKKEMNKNKGDVIIKNLSDQIREVFRMTGFYDIFKIE